MAEVNDHTVGAEFGDLRVPERHLAGIAEVSDLIESGSDPKTILAKVTGLIATASTSALSSAEMHDGGVLNTNRANFEKRFQPDQNKIHTICTAMRELGHKVVLTSGTFDIIHIGHAQYLESAGMHGDFLVVGVDSDAKVRKKKGEHRPIVSEDERLRMLSHIRAVDLLTLKHPDDAKWQLIKNIQPDTLVATEGTYTQEEVNTLESAFVERVVVLPPQATTSTTARLRRIQIAQSGVLREKLNDELDTCLSDHMSPEVLEEVRAIVGKVFDQEGLR
ncbi:adenylyltransferase/cytidyltransferase family protein [Candidatus Saccharibacteria bacterium]|nr:adenylyltransferase/cytidyltransferase family protein [Candidatus Saccharibacteria bacterium]